MEWIFGKPLDELTLEVTNRALGVVGIALLRALRLRRHKLRREFTNVSGAGWE